MDVLPETNLLIRPLIATFLLGFTTLLLLLWYSSKKQSYWKEKNVPYVVPLPIVGSVFENSRKPLQELELIRYQKHGKIYGHYEGSNPLLTVGKPELLRQIMAKDFQAFTGRRHISGDEVMGKMLTLLQGEDWKRVRTIVTPTFTTGKIKRLSSIFKDCSKTLLKNFKDFAMTNEPFDIKRIYGAFTMDVIASSAFSTKIDSHNDPNNPFVKAAKNVFTKVNWRLVLFTIFPGIIKFFGINVFSSKAREFFKNATLQIIEERKRTGKVRNDFLQLLLDTAKEVSEESKLHVTDDLIENYGKDDNEQVFKNVYSKKTLSLNELVGQCVIFFLAGYDTTASTLSFISYMLALNPDVQEKLLKEVDNALKNNNGEVTYEAVQSMKYLDNVISETLRLFPPVFRVERVADEEYNLGDTGITIPKGMIVTIPIYAMHRDPELFPDPEKFDPERFSPEERAKRDPYAYMPFGAGPRNCIGMRFALMEIKVCLIHVLSNFRFKRCQETKVPVEYHAGQFLLQAKDVTIKIEMRNDSAYAL